MDRKRVSLSGLLLLITSLLVGSAWGGELKELRVCADPNNLPFSNQKLEGFENRIAELVAKDLGARLTYTWWPHQRGLVRRTLDEERCDVLVGVPKGWDPVLWTKPYYRTAYVIVYLKDRGFKIHSLDDPILKQLRIGVHSFLEPRPLPVGTCRDHVWIRRPGNSADGLLQAFPHATLAGPWRTGENNFHVALLSVSPLAGGLPEVAPCDPHEVATFVNPLVRVAVLSMGF